MNYIKINNVMNYIPKSLRTIQNDDDQWLSWALQALRTVNTHELVVRDFALLEVVDHKVQLPKGLKRISSIKMASSNCNDAQLASLNQCINFTPRDTDQGGTSPDPTEENTQSGNSVIHYFDEACALSLQLFQVSLYYRECMQDMRFVGTTGSNYFTKLCYDRCRSSCYTEFSITPDGCLLTSCSSGLICLEYECEVRNDDGDFLVPDHPPALWNGMAHYAIAQYWLNRTGFKEQNSTQMYTRHLDISRNYMREAKSIFRMKNISFSLLSAITHSDTMMIRLPSVWSDKIGPNSYYNYGTSQR